MLADDTMINEEAAAAEQGTVSVVIPDPVRQGALDVISLRGLARIIKGLWEGSASDAHLDQALARMINLNGALARAVEDGSRRR